MITNSIYVFTLRLALCVNKVVLKCRKQCIFNYLCSNYKALHSK